MLRIEENTLSVILRNFCHLQRYVISVVQHLSYKIYGEKGCRYKVLDLDLLAVRQQTELFIVIQTQCYKSIVKAKLLAGNEHILKVVNT